MSIYEEKFAKSDKTDAVLVVDGKKLHVNKAVLSFHSDYFNALFNSNFKEKSMKEIPIKEVNFVNFATVLSLVHNVPIKFNDTAIESLLELADRFQLPAAKNHLENSILTSDRSRDDLIKLADKYQLNRVMDRALFQFKKKDDFKLFEPSVGYRPLSLFAELSKETNIKLFHRALAVQGLFTKAKPATPILSIYDSAFTQSDKTDAVLVVQGKKLHVNRMILSYYSDYFKTLFISEFKEKSMREIPIEDFGYNEFATLLSFVHLTPISPTDKNAEKILELADRLLLPSVKNHLELYLITSKIDVLEKIRIAEKYELPDLLQSGVDSAKIHHFNKLPNKAVYKGFSSDTKNKLFNRYLNI